MTAREIRRVALWVAAAALLAHAGLTAGGVWSFDAINYDDPQVIELVKNASVGQLLTEPTWFAYKPVYFLSLKIDALFGDGMVAVAHVVNVLLHALAVFLLVLLLFDIFGSPWIAGAAGLLFAVHPAHAENVAWLSERKDMLSLVFVLFAHRAYRKRRGEAGAMWLPALLLLLGGLTKGTVWTYAGILLIDALVHAEPGTRRAALKPLLPVFVVGLGGVVLDLAVALQSGAAGVDHGVSTPSLAAAMAGVHARYLATALVPAHLALDYAIDPAGSWGSPLTWIGLLLAAVALVALVKGLRARRALFAFAAGFWVLGLAPVNNVFPRTAALMADRYLYIPAIGLYLLLAVLIGRTGRHRRVVLGLVAVLLGVLCVMRTAAFKDSETVWADTIEKVPESALAYLQRGQYLAANKRYGDALDDATTALELRPRPELQVRAHLLRCAGLLGQDAGDELLEAANAASRYARDMSKNAMVRGDPRSMQSQAEIFRGQALERLGHTLAALDAYHRAVLLDEQSWSAHYNYGTMLAGSRNEESLDEALDHLRRAVDLNPGYLECSLQLATVYGRRGDKPRALEVLRRAEERHGRDADLLYARATIFLQVGNDWAEAKTTLRELREIDRNHPKGKRLEADINVAIGRARLRQARGEAKRSERNALFIKAIEKFDEAIRIRSEHWQAHLFAGDTLAERGLYHEARERYRKARRVARREHWLEGVMARAGTLEAALITKQALGQEDIVRAARIMAGVVELDVMRLDLGFAPLEEELGLVRQVAKVLAAGRQPDADHAAALLATASLLLTGDDLTALRDLKRTFARLGGGDREPALLDCALLLRAILYVNQAELELATSDYRLLARRRPKDVLPPLRLLQIDLRTAQTRYQIAQGHKKDTKRLADARATVSKVAGRIRSFADEHPESSTAGLLAVQAEINLERWIDALKRLNEMKERFERNTSVYRGFNMVYVAWYTKTRDRKLIEEASRALHTAMTLDQRDARTLMDASQLARVAGDMRSAVKHARRARELDSYRGGPASRLLADLHVALGKKSLEGGQIEEVRKAVIAARAVDPSRAGSWILEGELALKSPSKERFRVAYELARKAKELEPYNKEANSLLARCHRGSALSAMLQRGKYKAPRKGSPQGKAWDALPEDERAKRLSGFEKTRQRLLEQAIHDYEQALMLDPAAEDAKQLRREIASLRKNNPADQFARRQRAQTSFERGRKQQQGGQAIDALYSYVDAVRAHPEFGRAQFHLLQLAARLLYGLPTDTAVGRETADKYLELAFRSLDQLISLDPGGRFAEVWYYRGRLHAWIFDSNTTEEAREVSRVAAERAFREFLVRKDAQGVGSEDRLVRDAAAKLKILQKKD